MSERVSRTFFAGPTLEVARNLLGMRLVRISDRTRISGWITETEAYVGEDDQGCHARAGLTPRTRVMFGSPGHAYIYFTYGMHWMLNFITEREGFPAAVLIRAIHVDVGCSLVAIRRQGRPQQNWTDGPAKLCQALAIDGTMNGQDLCVPDSELWVETTQFHHKINAENVTIGPRVGLYTVVEPWKSMPWNYRLTNYSHLLEEYNEPA
jgi:DNA-3-methyladenine glycosylase